MEGQNQKERRPELLNNRGAQRTEGCKKYWQSLDIHISHLTWPVCSRFFIEALCAGGTAWQVSSFNRKYGLSLCAPSSPSAITPVCRLSHLISFCHLCARLFFPSSPYFFPPCSGLFISALHSTCHVSLACFYLSSDTLLIPSHLLSPFCPPPPSPSTYSFFCHTGGGSTHFLISTYSGPEFPHLPPINFLYVICFIYLHLLVLFFPEWEEMRYALLQPRFFTLDLFIWFFSQFVTLSHHFPC